MMLLVVLMFLPRRVFPACLHLHVWVGLAQIGTSFYMLVVLGLLHAHGHAYVCANIVRVSGLLSLVTHKARTVEIPD